MKYRIIFRHGMSFDFEAETIDDDGDALTLLDANGDLVIQYRDSDIASCLPIEEDGQ